MIQLPNSKTLQREDAASVEAYERTSFPAILLEIAYLRGLIDSVSSKM